MRCRTRRTFEEPAGPSCEDILQSLQQVQSILSKFNFEGSSQTELKNDNSKSVIHHSGFTIEESFRREILEAQKQDDLCAETLTELEENKKNEVFRKNERYKIKMNFY